VTSIIVNHDERSVLGVDEAALLNRKDLTLKYLFEDEAFVRQYGRQRRVIENEFLSYMALHLAMGGEPRLASKYLKDSVRVQPSSVFRRRFLAVVKHIVFNSRKSII
jgi:hypothetical protein